MDEYCAYLRKSRADYEAEQRGEGETLARHKKMLLRTAKSRGIIIKKFYCEVVSGETIAARPQMKQLLSDVEQGMWKGIFVVEVERLARGDTIDQGIVQRVFHITNTKIITPLKEYDPNNESDNEYFEFGLFMSRREYNTTKRRLKTGKIQAASEGKWPYRSAPYGYKIIKIPNDKGFMLEIIPDEADIVKLIFEWYTKGYPNPDGENKKIGMQLICNKLNERRIKPRLTSKWTLSTISSMLDNPTYIGLVKIGYNRTIETIEHGIVHKKRIKDKNCQTVSGLHPPIIDKASFYLAKDIRSHNPSKPLKVNYLMKNPLSGLVKCSYCGRTMIRRPYSNQIHNDTLLCPLSGCKNVGSDLAEVESLVLELLKEWLKSYKLIWNESLPSNSDFSLTYNITKKAITTIQSELSNLDLQLSNLYDLLERGLYDDKTFIDRKQQLIQSKKEKEETLELLRKRMSDLSLHALPKTSLIPKIEYAIETYSTLSDPSQKNELLTSVLEKIIYTKDTKCFRSEPKSSHIQLKIYPKLPP
ncbi:MAG: recombinase family protein [Velocimicrobium sp.]